LWLKFETNVSVKKTYYLVMKSIVSSNLLCKYCFQ
jgi:hypothetical protein